MDRITIDPAVMGGVPCLRGLRIPVATVVNMVVGAMTAQQIVDERYDRARRSLDRHASYIVSTFIAGATRPG